MFTAGKFTCSKVIKILGGETMIDRTRLEAVRRPGTDLVDVNSVFQEGDLLILTANGWKRSDSATAAGIRAIAAINKSSTQYGVVIGEQVVLNGTTPSNLKHANLVANSQRVYIGATVYVEGTDYTVNDVNGTIARIAAGSIPDGATVSVDYQYELTQAEKDVKGRPIENIVDETASSGRVEVIKPPAVVFLTNYDPAPGYQVGASVYDNGDGRLTSDGSGGKVAVGKVKQAPGASDVFLGVEFTG